MNKGIWERGTCEPVDGDQRVAVGGGATDGFAQRRGQSLSKRHALGTNKEGQNIDTQPPRQSPISGGGPGGTRKWGSKSRRKSMHD